MRALARDLGAALGVGGHLTALRRTRVGPFRLEHARTLPELEAAPGLSLPLADAVAVAFARRDVDADAAADLAHGRPLPGAGLPGTYGVFAPDGRVLALVTERDGAARPVVGAGAGGRELLSDGDRDRPAHGSPAPFRRLGAVQRWRGLDAVPSGWGRSVVTVGVFDGVHRGHQQLIGAAVAAGRARGLPTVLITFDPHPAEVVRPGSHPARLTSLRRRADLVAELGVDAFLVLPFTTELSRKSPAEFAHEVLVDRLHAPRSWSGANFTFGHRAAGTVAVLTELGSRFGFAVEGVELATDGAGDHVTFSSTYVRACIDAGDVEAAAAALGRPHRVEGVVVHGYRRGRALGFPTANIASRPTRRCPRTGCTRGASCSAAGACPRRSRSARTRRSPARCARSRPTCSTSTRTSTATRSASTSSRGCAARSATTTWTRWSRPSAATSPAPAPCSAPERRPRSSDRWRAEDPVAAATGVFPFRPADPGRAVRASEPCRPTRVARPPRRPAPDARRLRACASRSTDTASASSTAPRWATGCGG